MATTSNILTLLKFYASKLNNPVIDYAEFADYIHKYAQHHVDENSDLVMYCSVNYDKPLHEEIDNLVAQKQVVTNTIRNKEYLFVVSLYIEKYNELYKRISTSITIPLPVPGDIPKNVPQDILTRAPAADLIYKLLDTNETSDKYLYCLEFEKGLPGLLVPSTLPMTELVKLVLRKLQEFLHKEETHDYFLKKLTISNPGKELSIKNFFATFVQNPEDALNVLKNTGETYYYWSQMCYFLRQDYTKLKDFTAEDISILQSVAVVEIATSYYKSKSTERMQKENAFKLLDQYMTNPPYYYNWADIIKFKDQNGIPLVGQYTEQELKDHLYALTQESIGNQMPDLLIFKVTEDEGYYIRKEKVMPLIIRLCNDARILIKESISKNWYKHLLEYETLPEMKESAAFERCLEKETRACNPILYAILNTSFLPVVAFEDHTPGRISLFRDGALVPYSELLMISRQEIYNDAKIKLPFWYSIPIISWIIALFVRKPKSKKKKEAVHREKTSVAVDYSNELKSAEEEKLNKLNAEDTFSEKGSRRKELRNAAARIEKSYVPENSSLDREIAGYLHEWNDRIGKQNYDNLTEDVNALIRDYLRKILRSLKTESFTQERISSLAQSLVDSPSMLKIKNHPALKRYVELYLIKLVKNLPS